jgi:hypothetical protein
VNPANETAPASGNGDTAGAALRYSRGKRDPDALDWDVGAGAKLALFPLFPNPDARTTFLRNRLIRRRGRFTRFPIRRPRDTSIWKLEASLKCRSCRKGRYAPPVRMIKLTEARSITPYKCVHPDEER